MPQWPLAPTRRIKWKDLLKSRLENIWFVDITFEEKLWENFLMTLLDRNNVGFVNQLPVYWGRIYYCPWIA